MATRGQNYIRSTAIQSQTIHYVVEPQSTTQAIPQAIPISIAIPETIPQTIPQAIPHTIPHTILQAIPHATPQVISIAMPQTMPQTIPQAMPQTIPISIATPQTMPQVIQVTRQATPETWKAHRLNIAATVVSVITAAILITGISTKFWLVIEAENVTLGLWQYCEYQYIIDYHGPVGLHYSRKHGIAPSFTYNRTCVFTVAGGLMIGGLTLYGIALILTFIVTFSHIRRKRLMMIPTIVLYCTTLVLVVAALGTAGAMGDRYISQRIRTLPAYAFTDSSIKKWLALSWSFDVTAVAPVGILITLVLIGMSCSEYTDKNKQPAVVYTAPNCSGDFILEVNAPLSTSSAPSGNTTLTNAIPPHVPPSNALQHKALQPNGLPNALAHPPPITTINQRGLYQDINLDPIPTYI